MNQEPGTDTKQSFDALKDEDSAETPSFRSSSDCDSNLRPMVLIHGFMGSGDSYAKHAQRFSSNGYCLDRIFAFDWNTFDQELDSTPILDAFIDQVLSETGSDQVDLAGHSAGGGLSYQYLEAPERAAKVAHYAHIGSFDFEQSAGPDGAVPTLHLTSEGDTIVAGDGIIPGATNVRLTEEDHYSVATSAASFRAIYSHFTDGETPRTTDIYAEEIAQISGKVLSFGENKPLAGASVEVYEIDPATGRPTSTDPVAATNTDEEGAWGPISLSTGTIYDVKAKSLDEGDINPHYFVGPFKRSNPFLYLRTLPTNLSLVGLLLASVPFEREEPVLIVFSNQRAMVAGRDSLKIQGVEMLTEETAPADDTILALFIYDANENGESERTAIESFSAIPFLNGIDSHYPIGDEATISVDFNGHKLTLPSIPSGSEGPLVVILD